MTSQLEKFNAAFWSESFWFPQNITWKDFDNHNSKVYHPQISDLKDSCIIGIALLITRFIFNRYVATPVGQWLGIKNTKKRKAKRHKILEAAYVKNKTPNEEDIRSLVKQTDLSERTIQRWFRVKRNEKRSSVLQRFIESSWKFTVYFVALIYGLYVLWDKPWLTSSEHFFTDYPHCDISRDIYWYYMAELGLYISFLVSHFGDVKRKDFWELFIHHIATILLMVLSWVNNLVYIGTLILLIHDVCDPIMEFAKMANYSKFTRTADISLGIFVFMWFLTRLIIYPYRCVWSVFQWQLGGYGMHHVYMALLISLQVLHLIWTYFIFRCVVTIYMNSEGPKDVRSSEEETVSEDDDHTVSVDNGYVKKIS